MKTTFFLKNFFTFLVIFSNINFLQAVSFFKNPNKFSSRKFFVPAISLITAFAIFGLTKLINKNKTKIDEIKKNEDEIEKSTNLENKDIIKQPTNLENKEQIEKKAEALKPFFEKLQGRYHQKFLSKETYKNILSKLTNNITEMKEKFTKKELEEEIFKDFIKKTEELLNQINDNSIQDFRSFTTLSQCRDFLKKIYSSLNRYINLDLEFCGTMDFCINLKHKTKEKKEILNTFYNFIDSYINKHEIIIEEISNNIKIFDEKENNNDIEMFKKFYGFKEYIKDVIESNADNTRALLSLYKYQEIYQQL